MSLQLTGMPVMETGMLIRRPAADVFEAFVDPAITTQFWFTRGSGRLEAGERAQWDWEMYDVSVPLTVKEVEAGRRIVIEWPGTHAPTTVEWTFAPHGDDATFVTIRETGFAGDGDEIVGQVATSTEGFSLVLASAKAYLEHGLRLNLVGDRFPEGVGGQ